MLFFFRGKLYLKNSSSVLIMATGESSRKVAKDFLTVCVETAALYAAPKCLITRKNALRHI